MEFKDLWKYQLRESDWELLQDYEQILQVIIQLLTISHTDTNLLGSSCIPGYLGC